MYYIAWAAEWRSIYFHAGGSPQALATLRTKGRGQYVYNGEAFRYSEHLLPPPDAVRRRTTCTRPGRSCAASARSSGARTRPTRRSGSSRPDAPLEARPYGGTITVGYPYNTITYKYDRKSNTYLRSVTGETKQTDAADKTRIAPKNVVVMRMRFGPLNDGHPGAPRLEANVVGSGPAWISTNGRTIKGTWKKTAMTKPTKFYDKNGNEVTLTVGPDLRPGPDDEHAGYPLSIKAGSDTPPATARPELSRGSGARRPPRRPGAVSPRHRPSRATRAVRASSARRGDRRRGRRRRPRSWPARRPGGPGRGDRRGARPGR